MYQKGELGKIQYLAASHPQDMDGWPDYWEKMIPMHYATHVVSPCLGLMNSVAEYVSCFGSGTVREDIQKKSGNKFAVESCHIKIKDSDVAAHIWRFLYDTARHTARASTSTARRRASSGPSSSTSRTSSTPPRSPSPKFRRRSKCPTSPTCSQSRFVASTKPSEIHDSEHLSFIQGGGPRRLTPASGNEFITALSTGRDPWPNAVQSANWTCVGICAHQSAEKGGEIVKLPAFTLG